MRMKPGNPREAAHVTALAHELLGHSKLGVVSRAAVGQRRALCGDTSAPWEQRSAIGAVYMSSSSPVMDQAGPLKPQDRGSAQTFHDLGAGVERADVTTKRTDPVGLAIS